MRRAAVAAAVVVVAGAVAVVAATRRDDPRTQFESACATSGVEVPLPMQLARFPLPPGTRFTLASVSARGAVLASGYVPLSFPEAVQFFRARYRSFGVSEAEATGAASARFRRNGRTGSWKLDELPGCSTASLLTLRLKPS